MISDITEQTLFEEHRVWAMRLAQQCANRCGAIRSRDQANQFSQAGLIALMDCARRYDPCRGVNFQSFAMRRISGAVKDELRNSGWWPTRMGRLVPNMGTLSIPADSSENGDAGFLEPVARANVNLFEQREEFEKLMRLVPAEHRKCVRLKFADGLSMRGIANQLGISESRVCQKIKLALSVVRRKYGRKERKIQPEKAGKNGG